MRALARSLAFTVLSATVALGAGCSKQDAGGHAADEDAIRQLVVQTVDAAGRRDMDTYLKFYGPKAALVLPGLPITYGVESPRKNGFPDGYAIKMDTAKVEIAGSGDLGYAFGTYEQTAPDAQTKALADTTGKWMAVFKKQPDGKWGAIADTYNVDPPK